MSSKAVKIVVVSGVLIHNGESYEPEAVLEIPFPDAKRLIELGVAERIKAEK